MTIAELNVKVSVSHFTSTQDTVGKVTSSLTASWDKWAKVTQKNGSRALDNAAITYKETYEVVMRREQTRPTLSNYKLTANGKDMTIHSVIVEQIGKEWFETITAYTQT